MRPRYETPPHLTISITDTCNLACKWCYADCGSKRERRPLETGEWLSFIDYLAENGFIQVYFEGGEPFHLRGFMRILAHATPRMMTFVRTNGTLVTPRLASRLAKLGVGRMLVDIQGANAGTHDGLTGSPGSFDKACAAVRRLAGEGIKTDVLVILNRRNAGELQALADLAREMGAKRLGILRLYPLGRAKRAWTELSLSIEEQQAAVTAVRPGEGFEIMQSWHPRDRNCCWQAAAVNATGDSIGCMYLREYVNFGNVLETPLLETWSTHPLYQQLRKGNVKSSCSSCNENDGTQGGCRSTAYAFRGSWDAPDPFCSHLNDGIDLRVLPIRLLPQDA
ncbi:Putative mycofactocin radical SAM maturase MftC [Usitatibacter rugosus]|uniref:Mycofactocin radical SAM maturase MftC n=1 Tax=Usitatibacter rugosus TaxID=2732067 RepID=A0A6M4GVF6_9PROT|nr:radical SAM protein [Usitatibacter rugosus]QJR10444.1 Putative mycofactocin radical SAM maturase MftC [Usitatibacter rugosus]